MKKGPGYYKDIGKEAKDLLYKDCESCTKLTVTTDCPVGPITYSGSKVGDSFFTGVNTQIIDDKFSADFKVDSDSRFHATAIQDEHGPFTKTIISLITRAPYKTNVECQSQLDYAGITAGISISLDANPIGSLSSVIGDRAFCLGSDVSFDYINRNFTKCNVGLSFSRSNFRSSLELTDKGKTLNASCYNLISPRTNAAVGAELVRKLSTNETLLTIGTQHALDPLTFVKARVNNYGKASASIQREWRPNLLFTISGGVDIREIEKSAKIGMAIELKL